MDTISQPSKAADSAAGVQGQQAKKIESLSNKSDRVLFKTSAVFPFDFFPDEIVIDLNKVSVIYREFFFVEQVFPILIRNIEGVVVEKSVLFATLRIEVTRFIDEPTPIRYLKNDEAYRAKRIIMGLIACAKEGIDPSRISNDYLINKVENIGSADGEATP